LQANGGTRQGEEEAVATRMKGDKENKIEIGTLLLRQRIIQIRSEL